MTDLVKIGRRLSGEVRATARLALPLAMAQMGMFLMSAVDVAVVSRFDATHAAGVALGSAISFAFLGFGMGIASALEPLFSQAHGAKSPGRVWGWWRTGIRLTAFTGVVLSALALLLSAYVDLLGIDEGIKAEALAYMLARTPANAMILLWMTARSFLQSHQRTTELIWAVIVANIFNLVADVALVDGLVQWGAAGAGVATTVSSLCLSIVLIWAVWRQRPEPSVVVELGSLRFLISVSIPLSLQLSSEMLIFNATAIVATTLGAIEGNAHHIALQCSGLAFMMAVGISGATAARVGESLGQGDTATAGLRARSGILLAIAVMGVSSVVFMTAPGLMVALFNPAEEAVRELAIKLVTLVAIYQLSDGVQVATAGALRGASDIRFPFVVTVTAYWLVGFPAAIILCFPLGYGIYGLWYGLILGLTVAAIGLVWRYFVLERRGLRTLEPPLETQRVG